MGSEQVFREGGWRTCRFLILFSLFLYILKFSTEGERYRESSPSLTLYSFLPSPEMGEQMLFKPFPLLSVSLALIIRGRLLIKLSHT